MRRKQGEEYWKNQTHHDRCPIHVINYEKSIGTKKNNKNPQICESASAELQVCWGRLHYKIKLTFDISSGSHFMVFCDPFSPNSFSSHFGVWIFGKNRQIPSCNAEADKKDHDCLFLLLLLLRLGA